MRTHLVVTALSNSHAYDLSIVFLRFSDSKERRACCHFVASFQFKLLKQMYSKATGSSVPSIKNDSEFDDDLCFARVGWATAGLFLDTKTAAAAGVSYHVGNPNRSIRFIWADVQDQSKSTTPNTLGPAYRALC
jgi:hypothetical protein